MAITERDLKRAEKRMTLVREAGYAVSARYDRRRSRIVVALNTGVEIAFPTRLAEGLAGASPDIFPISKSVRPGSACIGLGWMPISMCRRFCKGYSAQKAGWRANSVRQAVDRAPPPKGRGITRKWPQGGRPKKVAKA